MLDARLRDHGYCERTDDERIQSQIDSKNIQRMYEWGTGSTGKISYFVVDKFCKLYGEYNNWDEYRIHLAEVHLIEDLISLEFDHGMKSDEKDEEIFEKYKKELKNRTKKLEKSRNKVATTHTMDELLQRSKKRHYKNITAPSIDSTKQAKGQKTTEEMKRNLPSPVLQSTTKNNYKNKNGSSDDEKSEYATKLPKTNTFSNKQKQMILFKETLWH